MNYASFGKTVLRGVGQVMLQKSEITGALFLIGILINSPVMCLGAIIGTIAGTLAGMALKYDNKKIEDGLFGFNGTLVGIALLYFFRPDLIIFALVVFGAALSSIVTNFFLAKKWAPFTFPFVIVTWILMLIVGTLHLADAATQQASGILAPLYGILTGVGQVMFQENIITGLVFVVAIAACSRISAIYALFGTVFGAGIAMALSFPVSLISAGIYGYNGALCGIAFAGNDRNSVFRAAVSIALSVAILYAFLLLNLPALTAPFVFSTWIVSAMKKH